MCLVLNNIRASGIFRVIDDMVRKGKEKEEEEESGTSASFTELKRDGDDEKVTFSMQAPAIGSCSYTN